MQELKKYVSPQLQVQLIRIEESMAAGSTTFIRPGGPMYNDRPEIEDWQDTGVDESFDWNL